MSGSHVRRSLSRRRLFGIGGGVAGGAVVGGMTWAANGASAATPWMHIAVVTANVGRSHPAERQDAIHDVRFGDPGHRPLVGWQEIREGDADNKEVSFISSSFGSAYQNAFLRDAKSFREPISVPKTSWKVVAQKKTFVHKGIAGVTPSRWINEVVVQHKSHPTLEFALINTHYIAGAYNGAKKASLKKYWDKHKQLHRARVLAHHQAGRLVIWTADTNNPAMHRATGMAAEKPVFGKGIDRVNFLPGNGTVQLQLTGTKDIDMRVDGHNARMAVFRIRLT